MRLLIAEDEAEMNRVLKAALQLHGYEVDTVFDGLAAVEKAGEKTYDLMIFDIMMPRMDGLTAVRQLRKSGNLCPVLMLTAKAEIDDRVEGLDAGADDYLTKPFALKELLARVRSMTRRTTAYAPPCLSAGNVTLDIGLQQLSAVNTIRLNGKETEMMRYLMLNPQHPLTTRELLSRVWTPQEETNEGIVWIYISYLRQKLLAIRADIQIEGEEEGPFQLSVSSQGGQA